MNITPHFLMDKKCGVIFTARPSLINWPLCDQEVILAVGARFSDYCRCGEVAVVEKLK